MNFPEALALSGVLQFACLVMYGGGAGNYRGFILNVPFNLQVRWQLCRVMAAGKGGHHVPCERVGSSEMIKYQDKQENDTLSIPSCKKGTSLIYVCRSMLNPVLNRLSNPVNLENNCFIVPIQVCLKASSHWDDSGIVQSW